MRLHTDDAGFSEYSNEITGYAFKADPVEITTLNRQIDGDNLQISINWTNPNDLLEIKNLQHIYYDIYRTETGNISDFSKVKTLDEVVLNTNNINYQRSYTNTDYLLDPSKSYSYKIVTRYYYEDEVNFQHYYYAIAVFYESSSGQLTGIALKSTDKENWKMAGFGIKHIKKEEFEALSSKIPE